MVTVCVMKDHEIIAILENCDEAQRARILAWARKRWPKKGSAASPAAPTVPTLTELGREDMLRRILGAPQDRTIAQPPPWPPIILTEPPRTAPPTEPDWTLDPWGRPYKVTCMAVGGSVD